MYSFFFGESVNKKQIKFSRTFSVSLNYKKIGFEG